MLSRQAFHRLRPTIGRAATRCLATEAQAKADQHQQQAFAYAAAFLGLAGAGAGVALMEAPASRKPIPVEDPNTVPSRPDLPTIPLEEVAEHCDEDSLWYTFRGGVYDLTFFIYGHPGGTPVSNLLSILDTPNLTFYLFSASHDTLSDYSTMCPA